MVDMTRTGKKRSWLSKTGQRWKVSVFDVVLAGTGIVADNVDTSSFAGLHGAFSLMGALLGTIAFAWLGVTIRCPLCRTNIGWLVMRRVEASVWFTTLVTAQVCPSCGGEPRTEDGRWEKREDDRGEHP